MAKLNQIIAVETGEKNKSLRELTDLHKDVQKAPLLSGISRKYDPKDEEGDQLPPESTRVQLKAEEVLDDVTKALTNLFDVTLIKETANAKATADVVVDGKTLLKSVPVTYLLFLEKQLVSLRTFVAKLPVLDPSETWNHDENTGEWATEPTKTTRTKKVMKAFTKAEATDRHPAQVDTFSEDVIVGYWTTTKFSGALPRTRVNELAERVDKLSTAVKFAREEANSIEVGNEKAGNAVFSYLFAK